MFLKEVNTLGVFNELSRQEYKNLLTTHKRHLSFMFIEERPQYSIENIIKVERNTEENCFHVYYKNGDWWHYTFNNEWY